jgi:mycoredoxin
MDIKPAMVYGTSWCSDCKRAVRVLNDQQFPYTYIDIERDDAARQYVVEVNGGNQSVPTIVFSDGSVLVEPANAVLTAKLTELRAAQ